jgi:hypothetical protein
METEPRSILNFNPKIQKKKAPGKPSASIAQKGFTGAIKINRQNRRDESEPV